MEKGIQIHALEVQNVKRIKAVRIDCSGEALTVIGGKNGQGKTSVLDSIAFALGGGRYRPSDLKREGSMANAEIRLQLSNGLIVERKGKNADLKVTDPAGGKAGQQLLSEFVSQLAIDLPKFLNATDAEKAKMLLTILGIGEELDALEKQERKFYDERHTVGQIADRKKKHAEELPCYDEVPDVPVSAAELIQSQQAILARNGENQRKRDNLASLERSAAIAENNVMQKTSALDQAREAVAAAEKQLEQARIEQVKVADDVVLAKKSTAELKDESTAELEQQLNEIEAINMKVAANLDRTKAEDEAKEMTAEYDALTSSVEAIRKQRIDLLNGADLPLPGLTIEDGNLIFNERRWDCMSGAEQLRVGTAIARKMNPACGFVLLDKAEQFDLETLKEFGTWLESEGLQAIATRVSTGDECSLIIEDGAVEGAIPFVATASPAPAEAAKPKFKAGEF